MFLVTYPPYQFIIKILDFCLDNWATIFATLGNSEIDFFVKTIKTQKTYVVEVKSGKNNSKSIQDALTKGKAKYVLFAKGNTNGGIAENVYTIPIFGIRKFKF